MITAHDLFLWKTIRLGLHGDMQGIRSALHMHNVFCQDPNTRRLLELHKPKLAGAGTKVDLFQVTPGQLGFTERDIHYVGNFGTIEPEEIYAAAAKINLIPCPFETGPYTCLQVPFEEIDKEGVYVAIDQIVKSHRPYNFFRVRRFMNQYRLFGDIGERSRQRPLLLAPAELLRQRWMFTLAS